MTEIELNEQLMALLEDPEKEPGHPRRTGRQYRRRKGQEKTDRRLAIIQLSGYAPHRGYVDWEFEGKTLLHTGKYIKYPKNSKCQRWLKRVSNKKVRACPRLPKRGTATAGFLTISGRCIKTAAVSLKTWHGDGPFISVVTDLVLRYNGGNCHTMSGETVKLSCSIKLS